MQIQVGDLVQIHSREWDIIVDGKFKRVEADEPCDGSGIVVKIGPHMPIMDWFYECVQIMIGGQLRRFKVTDVVGFEGEGRHEKTTKASKVWTRPQIDAILKSNDRAVDRAMLVLYARQTEDEKSSEQTKHANGRGFAHWAARSGSYYARWVQSGKRLTGQHLVKARKIALRHSKQLVEEANEKEKNRG